MNIIFYILFLCTVYLSSLLLTGMVRRYSLHYSLIDIPNERSSHDTPTPRGGGLSIVLITVISLLILYFFNLIEIEILSAVIIGGVLVSIMGWVDDHRHVSSLIRIFFYSIAVIFVLVIFGGIPHVDIASQLQFSVLITNILAALGMVWLVNLYNFMDGTDALAAVQTICTGLMFSIFFLLAGQHGMALMSVILVFATAGFLYWNWPPARIFMGDVGSCFIGFYFGSLALMGEITGSVTVIVSTILLSLFICDATFTLIMRIIKREKWYSAHRSHAYQRLVQMGVSHKRLAIYLALVNIVILWPLAYSAFRWDRFSVMILILTSLLLFTLWAVIQYRFNSISLLVNKE